MIKDDFNKNNLIIWHDGMRSMMGKCFKVVQGMHENEESIKSVGLLSPNGEDNGVWYFPLSALCKCAERCEGQEDGCCTQASPCHAGQGSCNADNECSGHLTCSENRKCEGTIYRYKFMWSNGILKGNSRKGFIMAYIFNSAYEVTLSNLCDSNFEPEDDYEMCQNEYGTNYIAWGRDKINSDFKVNRAINKDYTSIECNKEDDYVW